MSGRDKWRFAGIGPRERKARKTAAGRVISTIWRVVLFEREDLPCGWILPGHRQFLQKSLNRSGAISVYLTVCWMFLWPR